MTFEFKFIDEHHIDQCIGLLRSFFGPNYYGADKKYVAWQYRDSIFKTTLAGKDEYSILAAMKGNEILALDAFLPWKTMVNGQAVTTIWDIEWLNAAKIRGIGRALVQALRSMGDIYCGYGLNSLSRTAYDKLGYSIRDHIERKIAFLDGKTCMSLFSTEGDKKKDDFIASHTVDLFNIPYCIIQDVSNIADTYWINQLERFDCVSYKGVDYLQWRFINHPYLTYYIIALDERAEHGLAVVRPEKIKGHREIVLRILDMLPVPGCEHDLARAVITFGKKNGAILADYFCASAKYADCVCPEPFISFSEHVHYDIPMLFQPIEVRERKSINMVMDCSEKYKHMSFENFFATKADSDQDVYLNEDYKTVLI